MTRTGRRPLVVEQLENRVTPSASLAPSLSGGDLVIADTDAIGTDNSLTRVTTIRVPLRAFPTVPHPPHLIHFR